jgi:hypothetical protein
LTNATVRLYKINPATNGYDPVEGGNPLGCVLMGMAATYQLLIYNGQRAAQCTIVLSPSFSYNIRDLYMSFADAKAGAFSVLFDGVEVMTTFLRTLAAALAHVCQHTEANQGDTPIKYLWPGPAPAADDVALAAGMAAGIYYSMWEVGDVDENPGDYLINTPFRQSRAPSEVTKVKYVTIVSNILAVKQRFSTELVPVKMLSAV